jgi:hypothetical protein
VPKARIAQRLGISRTTVIKAVDSDTPPRYERKPGPTSFTVFERRRHKQATFSLRVGTTPPHTASTSINTHTDRRTVDAPRSPPIATILHHEPHPEPRDGVAALGRRPRP